MPKIPRPTPLEHLRGLPRIGDVAWTLEHLHRTYGPVVDYGYRFPIRVVFGFGPEVNQTILADQADKFLWADAFRLLEVVDGPTALVLSDGDEHKRRRRLVQPAFSIKRIDAHTDLIVDELERTLSGWTPGRELNAHAELRPAIRRIVVRGLFGDHMGARADEIGERLEPALRYLQRSPARRLDVDVRWNAYARARRATRAVDELILAEVALRRSGGVDADTTHDILSALLAPNDDGESLSDPELCDQIRSLIAAGYDTTSSSAAWLVHALGANPAARAALAAQVRDTIGDRPPTVDDLRAMPLVDGVVRETLRLWPPGVVAGRVANADVDLLGYRVPEGTTVLYSAYITHRLPEVWGDPEVFRPERWADGEPVPYSFVPFGGGYRKCIGFALATQELQLLAVRLCQVDYRLGRPTTRGRGTATFSPEGGVPITIAG